MSANILGKPLQHWSAADVLRICDEGFLEGADLELKEALSTKTGQPDVWMLNQSAIGEEAKDKLAREIVAFANAHGGTLLLGIEETDTKPARAKGIRELPKCAELAERFRLVFRDIIEPKLPVIEIEGISTSANGSGIVAFHVPPSRLAPHRHLRTKDCYVRRADRSETMTMREIQDLTLLVERGMASVEREFLERVRNLSERSSLLFGSDAHFLIHVTMVPLIPLRVHRVHARPDARPEIRKFISGKHELVCASTGLDRWKPIIGGSSAEISARAGKLEVSITQHGTIEYLHIFMSSPDRGPVLFLGWFLGLICSAIISAHKFRIAAGAGSAEFGIELELWSNAPPIRLIRLGDQHAFDSIADLPSGRHHFPRYVLGDVSEMPIITNEIVRDLANAGGVDFDVNLQIDFDAQLKQMGLA